MEMNQEEQDVEQATRRFYQAIETLISGGGCDEMSASWHHADRVTSRHPMDKWMIGWTEIWETWKFTASFGREDRGGSKVRDLHPYVNGNLAYVTVIFQASAAWGGDELNCTNVLEKIDGTWKIIHHHADPSPKMAAALERMLSE
jgi:ketosteroid isomerase-like protein